MMTSTVLYQLMFKLSHTKGGRTQEALLARKLNCIVGDGKVQHSYRLRPS